jgi:hypothetical protein
MISLLCGTNSNINKLKKKTEIGISGCSDGRKRWVKVFTQVLRANMKSLCCNIEFTSNDGNTKKYASDFILIENGQMNLDYNSLFIEIFGEDFERIPHLEDAKKLLQFIFKYSNTSLPGIATSATDYIFDLIIAAKSNNDSLKDLWRKLMCFMIKTVKMRKTKLTTYGGSISSLHVLTFPSIYKTLNEVGHAAANKVIENYFYYGKSGEDSFDLEIGREKDEMFEEEDYYVYELVHISPDDALSKELYRDNRLFVENCHFSAVYEDSLLCLSVWNLWNSIPTAIKPTLAYFCDYNLRKILKRSNYSDRSVSKFFSLEILAQWAIAYASHAKIYSKIGGFSVLKLFILNIQILRDKEKLEKMINSLNNLQLPQNLNDFLSRVKIPYLMNGPPKVRLTESDCGLDNVTVNSNMKRLESEEANGIESMKIAELSRDLSPFIKFGTCHRPLNSAGWDVLFDMEVDGFDEIGYIECKLWTDSVRLSQIYPYYKKACVNGIKFSILVAKNVQNSLHNKFTKNQERSEKPKKAKKIKTDTKNNNNETASSKKINYVDEIEKLGNNGPSRLNLYCIRPERETSSSSLSSDALTGNIDVEVIKEFTDPTGVFILIESNFNPPNRS